MAKGKDEEDKNEQQKNSFFPTAESIKMVGGLIAVIVGVGAITTLAIHTTLAEAVQKLGDGEEGKVP